MSKDLKYKYFHLVNLVMVTLLSGISVYSQARFGSLDLADFSGNGTPDLLFSTHMNNGNSGIAINSGAGEFEITGLPVYQFATSLGWADLNNDGFLDYFVFGSGPGNCAVYYNDGNGTTTKDTHFDNYHWLDPDVTVVDYDNDGDPDLFVSGWDVINTRRYSKMFTNNGELNFSETNLGLIEKGFGSSAWADVNGDGYLDLLLNGDGDSYGDEGSYDIYRLYLNDGEGGFTEKQVFQDYRQISVGDGSRFADWDNDGDFDIILTGWSNTETRQATCLFMNDGTGNFTRSSESDSIPGVSESSIEVADMNDDDKIDLLLTGYSGDYSRRIAMLYLNETAASNTRPGPPSNLNTVLSGDTVLFSWDGGTDAETPVNSISYNIYLRDITNDRWIINPGSDTNSLNNGLRRSTGMGNAFLNHAWPVYHLPNMKYAWSVQAIDAAYEGSVFPEEIVFAVKDTSILNNLIREAEGYIATAEEGTGIGQYQAGSVAMLQDTVNMVKPWVLILDKSHEKIEVPLNQALAAFHAARVGVDVDSLNDVIQQATVLLDSAEIGNKDGMYPQTAADRLDSAIVSAESVRDSAVNISDAGQINSMQLLVDGEVSKLDQAISDFYLSNIKVDYTLLDAAIDSAVLIYDLTTMGENNGSYPAEARTNLTLAIEDAAAVRSSMVSQQEADTAAAKLYLDITTYYGKVVIVNYEELGLLIDSANSIHDTVQVDDYEPGAKFSLKTAITRAELVFRNPYAIQSAVDESIINMENAIAEFLNSRKTNLHSSVFARLMIYPNPARDILSLDNLPEGSLVRLWNIQGEIVCNLPPGSSRLSIDITTYGKRPMLVQVISGSGETFHKMIIIQ